METLKESDAHRIVAAIETVLRGGSVFDPAGKGQPVAGSTNDQPEVQGMYRVGRGGLAHTAKLSDRREQLVRTGTPWLVALGCLLLAASVWQETARRFVANWPLLLDPSFRLVWVILLLGGGGTALFAVRLAAASQRADRERMEEFASDQVYRGETYFERLAD